MEVYKTIKRSVSATASGIIGGSPRLNSTTDNLNADQSTHSWIHPPDTLINGRVEYAVKMLGQVEVQKPKGSHIVREAIHTIRFILQVKRGETGHSGAKLRKVLLQISITGVNIIDLKTRGILFKHPLNRISFCADDKQDKRVFSYIAKNDDGKNQCFVFLSDKMAEHITLTIGEAFDLAYEKFIKKGRNLENQKQILLLKKRIVELEEKNKLLEIRLMKCHCTSNCNIPNLEFPVVFSLPKTLPISTELKNKNSTPPLPLAPPPRRTSISNTNDILAEIFENNAIIKKPVPSINFIHMFDDNFNPRAGEKNEAIESNEQSKQNTVEHFEALLRRVDIQLAEVQSGLETWQLERGDTGDAGRDWQENLDGDEQKDDDHHCNSSSDVKGC